MNLVKIFITGLMLTSKVGIAQQIQSLGVMEFTDKGVLLVGDNTEGAIHAFDFSKEQKAPEKFEINVYNVDSQIAAALGTAQSSIKINDIAVHPNSGELYVSVTRGHGLDALPALMKIDAKNVVQNIDFSAMKVTSQTLNHVPDTEHKIVLRGTMGPPTTKEIAKSQRSLRTLAIVSMEYHNGELFVAGVSNEEFSSVLRRMPFPFDGTENINNIEMYHIAHDQYETRAPIRSMVVQNINGKDQLVAAYTCSPLVLIPLDELKNNNKVKARSIGDMGNGQPIDMVPFKMKGEDMLFVTNNSRSPQLIPVKGLQNAKVVTDKDFERGPKLDFHPIMPYGPVGKTMMFTGTTLRIDLLNEKQFVSLNRDAETGSLDLETLSTFLPIKMHNIIGEFDVPKSSEK